MTIYISDGLWKSFQHRKNETASLVRVPRIHDLRNSYAYQLKTSIDADQTMVNLRCSSYMGRGKYTCKIGEVQPVRKKSTKKFIVIEFSWFTSHGTNY